MPREKQYKINLNEADKKRIEKLAKSHHRTEGALVGYWSELDERYNLDSPEVLERLKSKDEDREKFIPQEGDCPAMVEADNFIWCVWGVDGKPPAKKKLAKDADAAYEICNACKKTLEIKLENESYQVKVQELETKLRKQSTKKFKIPQCKQGARLDGDGLAFEGCPRSIGKPVSIEGYCKKINDGRGCDWFTLRLVGVGTEP